MGKLKQKFMDASLPIKIVIGIGGGIAIAVLLVFFGFLFGLLIQWLWNTLLVELFNFPEISFWQAVGLFILAKLFFGFGGGGGNQQQPKKDQKSKYCPKESEDVGITDNNTELSDLSDELYFKEFWQAEGKEAYEAYVSTHKDQNNTSKKED